MKEEVNGREDRENERKEKEVKKRGGRTEREKE